MSIVLIILLLKTSIAGFTAFVLRFPLRTSILVGLTLAQVGEFSFILAKSGVTHGLLAGDGYQWFLAVSVLTMAVAPFIISGAPYVADALTRLPIPSRLKSGLYPVEEVREERPQGPSRDHRVRGERQESRPGSHGGRDPTHDHRDERGVGQEGED